MIRDIHLQTLRELVEQSERDLAGYRRILDRAEQEQRVGMILPNPITPAPATEQWPAPPMTPPLPPYSPQPWVVDEQPVTGNGEHRREPYPTSTLPPIDGGNLPPKQEDAFGAFTSGHQVEAQSPKAAKEQQKWEQA